MHMEIKPGRYKVKECPTCKILHKGRGLFCSIGCANKSRDVTDETREKLRKSSTAYVQTPEGIANLKVLSRKREEHFKNEQKAKRGEYVLQEDDWYVVPKDGTEDEDGFIL
jgi:hypothetical protein